MKLFLASEKSTPDAEGLLNALLAEYVEIAYARRHQTDGSRLPSAEDILIRAVMVTRGWQASEAERWVAEDLHDRYADHAE